MPDRIFQKIFSRSAVFALLGAFGLWLGFPNKVCQIPILALAWPLALFGMGRISDSGRQALFRGWIGTFPGMLCAMYWLSLPVHNVGGLVWPAAMACAVLICAILALQGALFSFAVYLFRFVPPLCQLLALACLWFLLEHFFAIVCGFPWLPICGALFAWLPLVQTAEIFGSYALAGVWVFIVLGIFTIFPPFRCEKEKYDSFKNCVAVALPAFILLCGLCLYAYKKLGDVQAASDDHGFQVLMVEGNIDQNTKWLPEFQQRSLNTYMRLTREGLRHMEKSSQMLLIIWPETALPFFYELNHALAEEVRDFVKSVGEPLLFGAPGIEMDKNGGEGKIYNRAFLLDPEARLIGAYDKMHLVPFGEYAPSWLKFDFLDALLQGVGVYNEGFSAKPLYLHGLALGILICYEGIFPWLARDRVAEGANVLIDISNDGWFGDSPASVQHLALTVLRCIEQGRWLVRSTNTGISAIADERGRLILTGPQFRADFLAGRAQTCGKHTFFYKYGDYFPFIALATIFILTVPFLKRKRKN